MAQKEDSHMQVEGRLEHHANGCQFWYRMEFVEAGPIKSEYCDPIGELCVYASRINVKFRSCC